MPLPYLARAHGSAFTKLVEVDTDNAHYNLALPGNGREYTDAELRLFIAELEVSKERFCEKADRMIAMLKEILEGGET